MKLLFAVLAAVLAPACATNIDKNAETIDLSKDSVLLMTMSLRNDYRPGYPTRSMAFQVFAEPEGAPAAVPANTPALYPPGIRAPGSATSGSAMQFGGIAVVPKDKSEAMVSVRLPPGKYRLGRIYGIATSGLIMGTMDYAVQAPIVVKPGTVTYLGNLALVNVERKDKDDQASGAVIPLIDQAAAGFSGGTLKFTLTDKYDQDVEFARTEYKALKTVAIAREPLKEITLERTSGSSAPMLKVALQP